MNLPSWPDRDWTIRARWVFPVSRPPIRDGLVTIRGERIVAVEDAGSRRADVDLGDAAVIPGLVNAHTHLDLTGLRGLAAPSRDFTGWLRQVIAHRRCRSAEQVQADIRAGLAECLRFGTRLVGDISAAGASWEVLSAESSRAVVFHEVLGLPEDRAVRASRDFQDWLAAHPATPTCRPGVSPHAPYSVRSSLFAAAATSGVPAAVHLAETAEEQELLRLHRGPFVPFLRDLGVYDPEGLADDSGHVLRFFNGTSSPVLIIHGNYLPADARMPMGGSIVYCPRTHAAFGHPPHPFRDFLARGVRVALGTDSLASNPDLDLLAEARFLHRLHPQVPGAVILRMATLAGAEALGWECETGSLEAGKSADLVALAGADMDAAEPHSSILDSATTVSTVLHRGSWIDRSLR